MNTEKIVQLKDKYTGRLIGNVPISQGKTVDECIRHLKGKATNDGGIIIRGSMYDHDGLVAIERKISDDKIYLYAGEGSYYSCADDFASDCAQSFDYMDLETEDVDMTFFEQLRILWYVMHDPFTALLEKMELTEADCSIRFCIPLNTIRGWIRGEEPIPAYVRLMMAEAVGLLAIRNLA